MELLTHGSLERKRHGLLGFHPNHAHYISMLMEHEREKKDSLRKKLVFQCVCACVWPKIQECVYSLKVFQEFVVFVIPFEAFTLLVLGPQTPKNPTQQRYVISSNSFMLKCSPCHVRQVINLGKLLFCMYLDKHRSKVYQGCMHTQEVLDCSKPNSGIRAQACLFDT